MISVIRLAQISLGLLLMLESLYSVALPACNGRCYPNTYPTEMDQESYPSSSCSGTDANGENFNVDAASLLMNETNGADRFLQGFEVALGFNILATPIFTRETVACYSSTLTVASGLDSMYKKGMFAKKGEYPALARFIMDPRNPHEGMLFSLKVFLPESMAMESPPGPNDMERYTQDFIMEPIGTADTTDVAELAAGNVFEAGTATERVQQLLLNIGISSRRLDADGSLSDMRNDDPQPVEWEGLESLVRAYARVGREMTPERRLQMQAAKFNMNFGTMSPNRFGEKTDPAAKFFVHGSPLEVDCVNGTDYSACLTEDYSSIAGKSFDLYANLQASCGDKVEDAKTPWSTTNLAKVATLTLDKSHDVSMCTGLAFNPWHSATAHRPLGSVQRVRKDTYYAGAVNRGATPASPMETAKTKKGKASKTSKKGKKSKKSKKSKKGKKTKKSKK